MFLFIEIDNAKDFHPHANTLDRWIFLLLLTVVAVEHSNDIQIPSCKHIIDHFLSEVLGVCDTISAANNLFSQSCTFYLFYFFNCCLISQRNLHVAEGGDRSCLMAEGHSTQLQLLMCFWFIFVQAAAFHTTKMVALKLML